MTAELPIHDRRDDVQGLRAVAVALVVVYHLVPEAVPAGFVGVDVFFVISGFLITRNLLVSPPRGRRDVVAFWARRIRRLLPAAFLVLGVTMVASHYVLPATEWARTAREVVASALYVQNWVLVRDATDYLSPTLSPTPVQHYWSLAVEEQFYLVWPVLMIAAAALAVRRGRQPRSTARWVIGAVLGASLVYSVVTTPADPGTAYFATTTRIWELAAGGLLATWIPPTVRPAVRGVVAWVGLTLIGWSAVAFSTATPWPGHHALVPVVGAVLFIGSASAATWGPGVVLGTRTAQWTGDASYSIYLWHWPLVVLVPVVLGRDLTLPDAVGVLGLTLLLSWLTFEHVENRWRVPHPRTPTRRPFQLAVAGVLCVAMIAGAQAAGVRLTERAIASTAGTIDLDRCFGADAVEVGVQQCPPEADSDVVPQPAAARDDRATAFDDGCMLRPPYDRVKTCTYGDGPTQVALVGNSHATQWLPALERIADDQGLTITTYLLTACTTVDAPLVWGNPRRAPECERWRNAVVSRTIRADYDLIITSQRSVYPVQGHTDATTYGPWVSGMRRVFAQWSAAGERVLVLRDTPYPGTDVPQCVASHPTDQQRCSGDRQTWERPDPAVDAARGLAGFSVADLNRYLCDRARCHAVVGRAIAYFDDSHLTRTFVRTMTPYLGREVARALATD